MDDAETDINDKTKQLKCENSKEKYSRVQRLGVYRLIAIDLHIIKCVSQGRI